MDGNTHACGTPVTSWKYKQWKQQHVQPTREMIHEMDARYDFTLDDCNAFNAIRILDYPSQVVAARSFDRSA